MFRVYYSCECGINSAPADVRERRPDQDVLDWMDAVAEAVSLDHARRAPFCRSKEMLDLKIPIEEGSAGIGMRATRN